MEIRDEREVWNNCREKVCEMIRTLTKETEIEQHLKLLNDPLYRSTIDLFTQMMFTIETDERFIEERKKIEAGVMCQNMKSTLKIYGVDID